MLATGGGLECSTSASLVGSKDVAVALIGWAAGRVVGAAASSVVS